MEEANLTERKRSITAEERLFVDRPGAAQTLSSSCKALDYLIGKKQHNTRRIGSRSLIPMPALPMIFRSLLMPPI